MPKFKYSAVDESGKNTSGSIEASTRSSAAATLRKQGYRPLNIREEKGFDPNDIQIPFLKKKVKNVDIVITTRQLSTMIGAGVPLVRSLNTLKLQAENPAMKEVLEEIAHDVESGSSFADALDKHQDVFSDIYINMVRAAEAGGILDDVLKQLASQQEKDASMRKKIKSASTYPMVLLVITFIAFFGLMLFVVPKIGDIIKDLGGPDAELPTTTQVMLGISDFMINYWYFVIGIVVAIVVAVRRYIKTESGKKKFHQLLLKTPAVNNIVIKIAVARFARTFSALMSAGVNVLDSIRITSGAIGNKVIEEELRAASDEVTAGKQFSEPLRSSKIFPPIVPQMLAIGEETGQTDTILIKIAEFYEEEVDNLIDGISSIIEPVMIVVMGSMVGLIAASVIGPISSISENIGIILLDLPLFVDIIIN
jgi:type IV pilus assembly protein PilC